MSITLTIILSDEAKAFIKLQPFKAQQKIYYNIFQIEGGVMDKELFKKLENSEIWEIRTLFNGTCYRLFAFWGHGNKGISSGYPRYSEKDSEDTKKRDKKAEALRKEYFNNKNK